MGKRSIKSLIRKKYKTAECKEVSVRLLGDPDGRKTISEWNVLIEIDGIKGIWGDGATEEQAWAAALERLERVKKI